MDFDQIEDKMKSALMERCKIRSCFINDATGNLFSHEKKKYIITCRHVADDFFANEKQYVLLRDNRKILKSDLRYIARTNKSIDIAFIEILRHVDNINFYSIEDFEIIEDFNLESSDETNYFVFGYPQQLKYENNGIEIILWMSYLTIKHKSASSNKDFIYLDYPRESGKTIINENRLNTILPEATGLSGAFIFRLEGFKEEKGKLWFPSFAKIIAIQSSWNEKNWLKGCNTKYLFRLLKNENAI